MKQSEAARLTGYSRSYMSRVANGEIDNPRVLDLLNLDLEKDLLQTLTDERFIEICNTAIAKSRSPDIREYASIIKNAILNYNLKKSRNK